VESDRSLLIVEDDEGFARTLKRSFERRGYDPVIAASLEQVDEVLKERTPGYAVVDLKLGSASGLVCVEKLHAHDPDMLIVVLTGFASIATAVEAIKLGACYYLAKPSNTDDIEEAFRKAQGNAQDAGMGAHPSDPDRDRLQHLRGCAPARHASPHVSAQAGEAAGQVGRLSQARRATASSNRMMRHVGCALQGDQQREGAAGENQGQNEASQLSEQGARPGIGAPLQRARPSRADSLFADNGQKRHLDHPDFAAGQPGPPFVAT